MIALWDFGDENAVVAEFFESSFVVGMDRFLGGALPVCNARSDTA
jgi:hypothetical protein